MAALEAKAAAAEEEATQRLQHVTECERKASQKLAELEAYLAKQTHDSGACSRAHAESLKF